MFFSDRVRALRGSALRRFHFQPHLIAQCSANESPDAVPLPIRRFGDHGDRGALSVANSSNGLNSSTFAV
jgi:hypothetical protein